MKKLYAFLFFVAMVSFANAQIFIEEDFSNGVPPTGWSIDAHASNWSQGSSNNAGGVAPEARFTWQPQFNGDSRLIAPQSDLTGLTSVSISFKYMLDHYGGPYAFGVATRSGGGDWNSVWEVTNPSGSIPGEEILVSVNNSDVGAADFEFCFYFTGDSYNLNDWYIDDAKLFVPFDHDVAVKEVLGETYYDPNDVYGPSGLISNAGLNTETFDVTCEIKDVDGEVLYTNTQTVTDLAAGDQITVDFGTYTLDAPNYMYTIDIFTALAGDMDPTNDLMTRYIYTYTSERDMVLIEIGTGTWCGYCPGAAMGAHDLIENGHNVAVLEHHSGDSYENAYSSARVAYYGISGFPTAVIDGVESVVGGSGTNSMYSTYAPLCDSRAEVRSAFGIEILGGQSDGDYDITVMVDKLGPCMNSNVVLQVFLTETEIPENWQNQTTVDWVTRLAMPDANGTALDVINEDHFEIPLSFTIDDSWVTEKCELVAFIQDNDTKEILQGGKIMVDDMTYIGVEENENVSINTIYPNPVTITATIEFSLEVTEEVEVSVYSISGQKLTIVANGNYTSGQHSINWDASALPEGMYFVQITSISNTFTQKVMINR